jgi:hypothetical protein
MMMSDAKTVTNAGPGLLVEPGTAMVWLMMHHKPVPDAPPAEFDRLVAPVRNHHGDLIDWRFRPPSDGSHGDLSGAFERVHTWRERWLTERAIGDAATVRTVMSWGDRHVGIPTLHVLGVPDAQLDPESVPLAGLQARKLRTAMAGGQVGVALVDAGTSRVIRAFAPVEDPAVLLSATGALAELNQAGVMLRLATGVNGQLRDWSDDGHQVTARTTSDTMILEGGAADLLRQLAPGRTRVAVQTSDLMKLFSPLLASLVDMTELAGGGHHALYVRRGLS